MRTITLAVSTAVLVAAHAWSQTDLRCPRERFLIKTATDDAAQSIVQTQSTTIPTLAGLQRPPQPPPRFSRVGTDDVEQTIFSVDARIVGVQVQLDGDYQLHLAGLNGGTMTAAVTNPDCMFGSPFQSRASAARGFLNARVGFLGVLGFHPADLRVRVTGIGFWNDSNTNTIGKAPNDIALQPVLDISPAEDGGRDRDTPIWPSPDANFILTLSSDRLHVTRGSWSHVIATVKPLLGFESTIHFFLLGVPKGMQFSLAPLGVSAVGSSTVTIGAPPELPLGEYAVEVVASGGGFIHRQPLRVTVEPYVPTCAAPAISAQPAANTFAKPNSLVKLSVAAAGTALRYQWLVRNGSWFFTPIIGATSPEVTVNAGPWGGRYYVRVSNDCRTVESDHADIWTSE